MRQDFRIPLSREVKTRKELFQEINEFVRSRNGWVTSVPGAEEITIETLPGSTLPDELRAAGHDLQVADPAEGQRILPQAITEHFLTEGSTVPIRTTHAGIVKVERYSFSL